MNVRDVISSPLVRLLQPQRAKQVHIIGEKDASLLAVFNYGRGKSDG
jgi:hypothetical protein